MTKENFWDAVNKLPLTAPFVFIELEGDEEHNHLPLFDDHSEGERMLIAPGSIQRLRIERKKNALGKCTIQTEVPVESILRCLFKEDIGHSRHFKEVE